LLHASVQQPWVVNAADEEVAAFLERSSHKDGGFTYEDIRDNLLFNFNNESDLQMFVRNMTEMCANANVCLFGADYLANNVA